MKIAIVKLTAMGDIIQSAFILQFIKKYIPDIQIDWIVEEIFSPILENNPDINKIHKINLKSLKKSKLNIFKEIKKLEEFSKENYDLVIDLQANIKSAITSKLISKNVYGYDKKSAREAPASFFYKKCFDIPYHLDTSDRYRLLINKALKLNITKEEVLAKKPYLFFKDKTFSTKPYAVFIIGASWKSKIYPKEKVQEVIDALDIDFFVPYSNDDEEKFVDNLKGIKKIKLNLDELKALISKAKFVIGNDTGPTYIAWANNIPSIVLFGPVPPNRVYKDSKTILLKSPSQVDPYKLNKDDFSIKEIDASKIISYARKFL
jgi:heptosyltransferase-1